MSALSTPSATVLVIGSALFLGRPWDCCACVFIQAEWGVPHVCWYKQVDAPKLLEAWKQLFLKAPWDPTHKVSILPAGP